jgi:hypothetical protein
MSSGEFVAFIAGGVGAGIPFYQIGKMHCRIEEQDRIREQKEKEPPGLKKAIQEYARVGNLERMNVARDVDRRLPFWKVEPRAARPDTPHPDQPLGSSVVLAMRHNNGWRRVIPCLVWWPKAAD